MPELEGSLQGFVRADGDRTGASRVLVTPMVFLAAKFQRIKMKSCPVCKRTFDELMTFCLVDGSILSAPFEPHVAESRLEPSRPEPETQLLSEPPSPPPTRAIQTSSNEQPPKTVAAEVSLPLTAELSSPRTPPPFLPQPPPMKTIIAPAPEIAFTDRGATPALVTEDPPKRGRWLFMIGALALCGIAAAAAGWIILRNRTHDNLSAPATALRPENNSKNAAPNSATITGATFNEKINDTEIALVSIPAGSFLMGSPDSDPQRDPDEGPQNTVTVPNFYLSKFEITQAEYRAVMRDNPARFKGDQLPVDSVSWSDANEFCKKLSAQTGRAYRLPTEAE